MDHIRSDFDLNSYASDAADAIIDELERCGLVTFGGIPISSDWHDVADEMAWNIADASAHVIYWNNAHAVCQNCTTDAGEEFVHQLGGGGGNTYDEMASLIAHGEILSRIIDAVENSVEGGDHDYVSQFWQHQQGAE